MEYCLLKLNAGVGYRIHQEHDTGNLGYQLYDPLQTWQYADFSGGFTVLAEEGRSTSTRSAFGLRYDLW